jgi:sulfite exporter TauE/SafE
MSSRLLNWSRPGTWGLLGFTVAIVGAVIMSIENAEGGVGRAVVVAGVLLMLIGLVAYLVGQVRKAIQAGRN